MDIDEAPREEVSDSSDNDISQNIADDRILNRSKPKECKMVDNEAMLGLMNKVCELCHDMYSHTQPNMRVKCSSNCFRNKTFKKCLNLFSPSSRSLRHTLHRKHSSIVLD
ncbi:hypothetical protein M3Y97_00670500 [Aphelenchoides bicaudatus]|nr:hypothetical protein M3Y97_00670500 [Aphelenchoides bicaudatus]